MRKLFSFISILALILLLAGCKQPQIHTDVPTFSYEEYAETYKGDLPGVKHSGFVNTDKATVLSAEDALERAKKECTISWDSSSVSFDPETNVWMVSFGPHINIDGGTQTVCVAGGDQSVFLSNSGKTLLIVYGE